MCNELMSFEIVESNTARRLVFATRICRHDRVGVELASAEMDTSKVLSWRPSTTTFLTGKWSDEVIR
jgi:hypothetical protein